MKLLEDSQWSGMRHFDAHAYRTEDEAGVWQFASGCMRNYLILAEKAERFRNDAEITAALEAAMAPQLSVPTSPGGLGADALATIRATSPDIAAMTSRGYGHERLDQLVTELLLGVR